MADKGESMDKINAGKTTEEHESLSLEQNRSIIPQWLRIKTKRSYDVKLPTYEESQEKYGKFLYTEKNNNAKQKQEE